MTPQVREAEIAPIVAAPVKQALSSQDFIAPDISSTTIANDIEPKAHKRSLLVARRQRKVRLMNR